MFDRAEIVEKIEQAGPRPISAATRQRINVALTVFCATTLSITMFLPFVGINTLAGFRGGNPYNWQIVQKTHEKIGRLLYVLGIDGVWSSLRAHPQNEAVETKPVRPTPSSMGLTSMPR